MRKPLLIAILSTAALFGCKKKSDDPAPVDKVVEPAPSGAPNRPTATALANADEYKAKGHELNSKLLEVFKETDCAKLATAISGMIDANRADIAATNGWEKAHPDDKKAFEEATAKDIQAVTGAAMDRCKDSPQFKAAMEKLASLD